MTPATDHPGPHDDDLALVKAIVGGDRAAWDAVIARHQDQIYAICVRTVGNREWARDLAQEALLRIVRSIGRYDGRARLSTWMVKISLNVCLSALRSEKLRRHAPLDAPGTGDSDDVRGTLESREPDGPSGVEDRENRAAVLRGLYRIDDEQRAILILRDARGLDYEQIADALGVPLGTVKSRLFRARVALRAAVERHADSEAGE